MGICISWLLLLNKKMVVLLEVLVVMVVVVMVVVVLVVLVMVVMVEVPITFMISGCRSL